MIDVKEAKEAKEANGGWNDPFAFRDPAEMVTISADRFEELVRLTERLNQQMGEYQEQISRAYDFINTVAREWAEKGSPIPRYEDMSRMAEILGWKEPYEIHDLRITQRMIRDQAKKEKEAANNGEAAD